MNGYAPQIPFSTRPVAYPVTVAGRLFWPPHIEGTEPPPLDRHRAGNRTFDFAADGLAHYGMLPDFLQALWQDGRMAEGVGRLFATAGDTIDMWERVEAAARRARMSLLEGEDGPVRTIHTWWSHHRRDTLATTQPEWAGGPGDTVAEHDGYAWFRNEGAAFSPTRPRPAGTVPLRLWWSASRADNVLTADPTWVPGRTRAPDYGFAGLQGYVYPPDRPRPGTAPLHRWFSEARGDHFTTSDPAWAGRPGDARADHEGYRYVRLEGYVIAPLTPLFSWWSRDRRDNFATTDPTWTGLPGYARDGYAFSRIEGRVFSPRLPQPPGTVPLRLWWSPSRADNVSTTDPAWSPGARRDPDYGFAALQGYVHPPGAAQPAGTVPLFRWFSAARGDHFITSDPGWAGAPGARRADHEGYEFVRLEGYVYPA